jgi:hypothetical protein
MYFLCAHQLSGKINEFLIVLNFSMIIHARPFSPNMLCESLRGVYKKIRRGMLSIYNKKIFDYF